jgi:Family of unknown function (DUF5908)
MPIVIDEVLITVEVENRPAATPGASASAAGATPADKQALVAECVERVLAILDARKEP